MHILRAHVVQVKTLFLLTLWRNFDLCSKGTSTHNSGIFVIFEMGFRVMKLNSIWHRLPSKTQKCKILSCASVARSR